MTRIKSFFCALLTGVILLQPLFMVSRAAEVTIPDRIVATIPGEMETSGTLHDAQQESTASTQGAEEAATEASDSDAEESAAEETIAAQGVESEEAFVRPYKDFPNYSMEQYGHVMYGDGTVKDNGCGITCLAAVATCLTGYSYYPDELARYFGSHGNNNIERMLYGSDMLRLPYYQAENYHEVLDALRSGKIAIQLMNSRSIFTDSQHFIVVLGYNSNGFLEVYDPSAANREHWLLKKGFENGFTEDELCWGFSGAWIYDPAQVPENPYIYQPPAREYAEPRYDGIVLTEDDIGLLARLVWVEARGESAEGQQAVAEVVLNRLVSGRFQNSLRSIILDEEQFVPRQYLIDAKPGQAQYEAIDRALYGPYVLPIDVYYYGTRSLTNNVWGRIGGHIFCYADK